MAPSVLALSPSPFTSAAAATTTTTTVQVDVEDIGVVLVVVDPNPKVVTVVSRCDVFPDRESTMPDLRLSVSDLPMLSCHYIQKGLFFPRPPLQIDSLVALLLRSLSRALSLFPALAGRFATRPDASIHITCNDAGVEFIHAKALHDTLPSLFPPASDVPIAIKSFFALDDAAVSYTGHYRPLAAFQLTQLADGAVFIGCTVNHAVVDGTSFWNFFNAWAELSRRAIATDAPLVDPVRLVSRMPNFRRDFFGGSTAVLQFPGGAGPEVTFDATAPLRERIFHFSRKTILELKSRANAENISSSSNPEIQGKQSHDPKKATEDQISSFQSLCAQLWISVTRARKHLAADAPTTFRMAVNCRHRVAPPVDPLYFGNAIQSIPTTAGVGEVRAAELQWAAGLLHRNVAAHGDKKVRVGVEEWEAAPRCFPLGNPDGAGVTMGSSPRFPMYDGNDFGWGGPLAVRSGRANKFDGKISAFPGRDEKGSVDLEVCLSPDGMAALLADDEFMRLAEDPLILV